MRPAKPTTPPWEVLLLISHFLQPETLVKASCVCKSWREAFTSENLWRRICLASYPCSFHLLVSGISPYHLFSLFISASKRRYNHPPPLRLSLNQIFFTIEMFHGKETLVTVLIPGEEAMRKNDCTFRFEVDLTAENVALLGETGELTAGWTVVMKGFDGAFAMMEREGKGRVFGRDQTRIWFDERLPVPDCSKGLMPDGASMEAEMVVEIVEGSNGKKMVERQPTDKLDTDTEPDSGKPDTGKPDTGKTDTETEQQPDAELEQKTLSSDADSEPISAMIHRIKHSTATVQASVPIPKPKK
ncbi:putative F-box protein [Carex littledalei]|uniref:F-box protein n=1 Tax=Carex littledalei TaxID=544730 RepID=A0A833R780_9POAL|nr:putative F-box protein [Carex littledalei]